MTEISEECNGTNKCTVINNSLYKGRIYCEKHYKEMVGEIVKLEKENTEKYDINELKKGKNNE